MHISQGQTQEEAMGRICHITQRRAVLHQGQMTWLQVTRQVLTLDGPTTAH